MSYPKLLNAPAQRLLLTFIVTAGVAVAINTTPSRTVSRPMHAGRASSTTTSRTGQNIDYSQIDGVQRWGLNE
jgi:hypothetical protein